MAQHRMIVHFEGAGATWVETDNPEDFREGDLGAEVIEARHTAEHFVAAVEHSDDCECWAEDVEVQI